MGYLTKIHGCLTIENYGPRKSWTLVHILTMKSLLITFCLLASHAILPGALADSLKIEFTTDDTFSIQVARVEVGDKVEWLPTNDGHNVEFLADPEKFLAPKKSDIDAHYSLAFTVPGVYMYRCTALGYSGMLGLLIVGNDFHNLKRIKNIKLSHVATSVLQRLKKIAESSKI